MPLHALPSERRVPGVDTVLGVSPVRTTFLICSGGAPHSTGSSRSAELASDRPRSLLNLGNFLTTLRRHGMHEQTISARISISDQMVESGIRLIELGGSLAI